MLISYRDCEKRLGNHHQIKKAIEAGKIFKIEAGIYSETPDISEISLLFFKYPYAVFTMNSAFYYHGLTDVIPEKYYLATSKDARKIKNDMIRQSFHRENSFSIGISSMEYRSETIRIYDKERMLIELIRNKNRLPFDYYKEIIESYRKMVSQLDLQKLQDYAPAFPKQSRLMETIELEVL